MSFGMRMLPQPACTLIIRMAGLILPFMTTALQPLRGAARNRARATASPGCGNVPKPSAAASPRGRLQRAGFL